MTGQLLVEPDELELELELALGNGRRALAAGDLATGRHWFEVAYRAAEQRGDATVHNGHPAQAAVRRHGRRWEVSLRGRTAVVPDGRGVRYLAVLAANPGQDILAAALVAGVQGGHWDDGAPTGAPQAVLDVVARQRYRQRLSELDDAIEQTEVTGDQLRSQTLAEEREWLIQELSAAAGLAGRERAFATNEERARVAVGKAIRRAIEQVGRDAPAIGEHLRHCVQTGRYCVYRPDR